MFKEFRFWLALIPALTAVYARPRPPSAVEPIQ
jgi:hypothetical protein